MNRNYVYDEDSGLDEQQTRHFGDGARWFVVYLVAVFAGIALLAFGGKADAQTVPRNAARLTWTTPAQNTDGSAIPATCPSGQTTCGRLSRTLLEYGTCNGSAFGNRIGDIFVAAPGAEATVSNLVVQTYCFRAFAQNDYGVSSATSNVVARTIAAPQPNPPLIAIDATAYEIRRNSTGALIATRIGVVAMGTACSAEQQQTVAGVSYALVPREAVDLVNWPSTVRITDVWARCG